MHGMIMDNSLTVTMGTTVVDLMISYSSHTNVKLWIVVYGLKCINVLDKTC